MTLVLAPDLAASLDFYPGASISLASQVGIAWGFATGGSLGVFSPRVQGNSLTGAGGVPMQYYGLYVGNRLLRRTGVFEMPDWSAVLVSGGAALTPGATYYVGNTTGQLSTTPCDWVIPLPLVTTASQQVIVQPIGVALTATKMLLKPGRRSLRQYLQAGISPSIAKVTWARDVEAIIQQSGAGGGSGRRGAAGAFRCGGGGGCAGARSGFKLKVAEMASPGVLIINNPGNTVGGAGQTVNSTNGLAAGNVPSAVVTIDAVTMLTLPGAGGGQGGDAGTVGGIGGLVPATLPLPLWGNLAFNIPPPGTSSDSNGGVGPTGVTNDSGIGAPGAGAGITTGNVVSVGGSSGVSGDMTACPHLSSASASGGINGAGAAGANWPRLLGWPASGGGAGSSLTIGFVGGQGGFPGGGGGGGAASVNGFLSGAGGNGNLGCSLLTWEE